MAHTFNGNAIQTVNIVTSDIDHLSAPDTDLSMFVISHANDNAITNAENQKKKIVIKGQLNAIGLTLTQFESLLDTFKGYFVGINKNLDLDYAGTTRRYIATPQVANIDRPGGLLFANFQVSFLCKPYGSSTFAITLVSNTTQTAATINYTPNFLGSAPIQQPIVTITYTANSTGGTAKTVMIGNNGNGQVISITRIWSATDVLVVNSVTKSVTVNGLAIDFTGGFPEFPLGPGSLNYTDNFTSRSYNINVSAFSRWL